MGRFLLLVIGLAAALAASEPAVAQERARIFSFEDPALDAVTSRELVRFESDKALAAWADQLEAIIERRRRNWFGYEYYWGRRIAPGQYAQAPEPPCPPSEEDCPRNEVGEVVMTATKVAAPSITNNQEAGVDEGDIVKQIGPFLLVLQDGRIFSIDTRGGLRLADRVNVYREETSDAWYDEMLVQDHRVIVTAYSYREEATEISVFALDAGSGRLTREGVFLITSDDYYDADNYATRIVGDRLVIYTPYDLEDFIRGRDARPLVRRWLPEESREQALARARPLFAATDIYRPVQRVVDPLLHTISVCPLGQIGSGRDLECRTTGFIGAAEREMYVSPEAVYLWTSIDEEEGEATCRRRAPRRHVRPAAVFRLPIAGGHPKVAGMSGRPFDQFSMDSRDGEFRALVAWRSIRCEPPDDAGTDVAFIRAPERLFSTRFQPVADSRFWEVPSPGVWRVENRFTERFLVYGGRNGWPDYPPDEADEARAARAVAVPIRQPDAAVEISVPHNLVRLERLGDDVVLTGYPDDKGLIVSLLKLGARPRLADSLRLAGRFESEGRSHAFNAVLNPTGAGLMGLPTVRREAESGRLPWRSDASDLSFVAFAPQGRLADAGELLISEQEEHEDYECEVSCVDWYGNSRPIFTQGRIFGLMGTELVEAQLSAGRLAEILRLDLTTPPPGAPAPFRE